MTEKQRALNAMSNATRILAKARDKEEADKAYDELMAALNSYYHIMWGERPKT